MYDMSTKLKIVLSVFIVAAVMATTTYAANAAQGSAHTTPGWGFGDKNHVHVGPPGHSVHP